MDKLQYIIITNKSLSKKQKKALQKAWKILYKEYEQIKNCLDEIN